MSLAHGYAVTAESTNVDGMAIALERGVLSNGKLVLCISLNANDP